MKKVLIVLMVILLLFVSSCQRVDDSEELNEKPKGNEVTESSDIDLEPDENMIKGFPEGELIEIKEKGQPLYEQLLADEAAGQLLEMNALFIL